MSDASKAMLSHYRLIERIGRGGMGVVYKAIDTRLNRPVAVKVLRPDRTSDPDRRRQLLREARTAAALNHPNICTVHEVGEVGPDDHPQLGGQELDLAPGMPFLVMELVEGESLRDRLDRHGALRLHELLDVATQVAQGLQEAHSHRVVHRDLKPQNVAQGPGGRWKILDFGLATPVPRAAATGDEDGSTVSVEIVSEGRVVGTVAYMSPEQVLGREVDGRSDLFSFGAMLYELSTGKKPFPGRSVTEISAKILETDPSPVTRWKPSLPDGLAQIVERCLRKGAAERFGNAAELSEALAALQDSMVPGSPPGKPDEGVCAELVAVLPFAVRGGDAFAYLGEGLVDLLSTKLDGAGDLRSVDAHAILCCVGVERRGGIDPSGAREIARRYGAGLFILGNIVEAGGTLSLSAALYSTVDGEIVSRSTAQGAADEIFDLVDRLTVGLVARRCGGPDTRLTRIAATTTESFPALKAYLEGESFMRAMRRPRAAEAYRRAVAIDPKFALAWYRLSVASLWAHRPDAAWEAAKRAVEDADRLSDRDRDLLEAFHALLRGANDEAERLYRSIVGAHPGDVEAWFQLGDLLFHHGPLRGRTICESKEVWERILSLDPGHLNAHVHLVAVAASAGDDAVLESSSLRVLELAGDGDPALWMRALRGCTVDTAAREASLEALRRATDDCLMWAIRFVAVYRGDVDAARPLVDLLMQPVRSAEARALGHLYAAHLDLGEGKWGAARRALGKAAALHPAYALEHRALLAAFPLLPPAAAEIEQERAAVMAWEAEALPEATSRTLWLTPHEGLHVPLREYLAGLLSARLRDPDTTIVFARKLEAWRAPEAARPVVDGLAASLRAHAAWERGQPHEALASLEQATMKIGFYYSLWSPFFAQDLERFQRAEWLRETARLEEALPWYSTFGENSVFDRIYVAPSHLRRGQIYERLGRLGRAAKHYARFVALWKDCDPALRPLVVDAERRLEKL